MKLTALLLLPILSLLARAAAETLDRGPVSSLDQAVLES
jgi:hypothetical protein